MTARPAPKPLPLAGIRVLEFGHTILGPCCGLVLADPPQAGEHTREILDWLADRKRS